MKYLFYPDMCSQDLSIWQYGNSKWGRMVATSTKGRQGVHSPKGDIRGNDFGQNADLWTTWK